LQFSPAQQKHTQTIRYAHHSTPSEKAKLAGRALHALQSMQTSIFKDSTATVLSANQQ
jgi:hypothetical protein